jgi:hypothetical protein
MMEKQTYQVNILQIVIPPCSSWKNPLANPFSYRQCSLFVWHHICSSFQHDPQCSRCLFCCLAALVLSKISMLLRTFFFYNISRHNCIHLCTSRHFVALSFRTPQCISYRSILMRSLGKYYRQPLSQQSTAET